MVNIGNAIAEGAVIAITIKAIDEFSNVFGKVEGSTDKLTNVMKISTSAILGVGTAMAALGVSSVKVAADFEQTKVAFTTMLGSAEEAQVFLAQLADFAKKTPFTLVGVEKAAKQLMAVGFEANDVIPTLKSVGDVASGLSLGEEGLQRLILNLGQVRNQGKLTGRELRDFAVAGVPLLDQLANQLGVTVTAIEEMVSAGEISSDMVITAFNNMTGEGGKFENLMAKQAETVKGKFSNLQDTITLLAREVGTALLPMISSLADSFLNDVLPAIKPLIPPFTELATKLLNKLGEILPEVTPLLIRLADIFIQIFDALIPIIDPLLDLSFIILDAMLNALEPLMPALVMLTELLGELLNALMPLLKPIIEITSLILELGLNAIFTVLGPAIEYLTPTFRIMGEVLNIIINAVSTLVGWIYDLANALSGGLLGKLSDLLGFEIPSKKNSDGGSQSSKPDKRPEQQNISNLNQDNKEEPTHTVNPVISLNDFIITKRGEIIKTNQLDNLIGVKDLNKLIRPEIMQLPVNVAQMDKQPNELDENGINIIINIDRIYGIDADDISNALQRKLNVLIRR
jgi:tape measure domain-containing protein